MNNKNKVWHALRFEIITTLENQGVGVLSAIQIWNEKYRPLVVASLEIDGDYSITIGDKLIEWSVQK